MPKVIPYEADPADALWLNIQCSNATGDLVDPDTLKVRYRHESVAKAKATELEYGIDTELVRLAQGHYRVTVKFATVGNWYWAAITTGVPEQYEERQVFIRTPHL